MPTRSLEALYRARKTLVPVDTSGIAKVTIPGAVLRPPAHQYVGAAGSKTGSGVIEFRHFPSVQGFCPKQLLFALTGFVRPFPGNLAGFRFFFV